MTVSGFLKRRFILGATFAATLIFLCALIRWPHLTRPFMVDSPQAWQPQVIYGGDPWLIWGYTIENLIIGVTYLGVSVTTALLLDKFKAKIPPRFRWIIIATTIFILLSGFTYITSTFGIWFPLYRINLIVRGFAAVAAVAVAVNLPSLLPKLEALMLDAQENAQVRVDLARAEVDASHKVEVEGLLERERAARLGAERLNRLKDEFLATLSHELRTPMTTIMGWTQMLLNDEPDTDRRLRLDTIARAARSQLQLIDDLLDVSRIINGKVRLDVRPLQLGEIAAQALEAIRPAALAKRIRVESQGLDLDKPVYGDPGRLQQVIWNLLTNAIKFTPEGGRVKLEVKRDNGRVTLCVEDSGIGIDPEFLPFVFERFRQANQSISRRHGGLGLGLAIVRHIIELHGGEVAALSEGEGFGSAFKFTLPKATSEQINEQADRRMPPYHTQDPALDGIKVLAVDDDHDTRDLIRFALEKFGAAVTSAASAAEALAHLDQCGFDVIVSDIGMPDIDGYEFLHRARAKCHTPAIALTAYARLEDQVQTKKAGFDRHLSKPVEMLKLASMVASLAHGFEDRRRARVNGDVHP